VSDIKKPNNFNPSNFYKASAVATKDMIFVSGAIPWANGVNGTIPTGIEAQTVGIPIFFYANTY
jgi:enamine deaminase RidA (YjgF/YER057c/UK114 family)